MRSKTGKITDDELIREITDEALLSVANDQTASCDVLQELAECDLSSSRVREALAANKACSNETNLLLCDDEEANVRVALAKKATHICSPGERSDSEQIRAQSLKILRSLAADTEEAVRATLAEEIKECDHIPVEIAQTLARDVAESVAMPVLEYSPLLEDEDLLEIISTRSETGILCAISRRTTVSADVSDSLVDTKNQEVIPSLLNNTNAQIREDALDRIVEGAKENQSWQEALITRPKLPDSVFKRVEQFISVELINHIYSTGHVDVDGAKQLMGRVKQRLSNTAHSRGSADSHAGAGARDEEDIGRLSANEKFLAEAIGSGNYDAVYAEISHRAKLKPVFVRRAIISKHPKIITALCWKAGFSAPLALLVQKRVAALSKEVCIEPGAKNHYALSPKEMNWHLEVFGANRPCNNI